MKAKKKYGQNFITDINLIKKIVSSANLNNKNVIEIGPGKGALTPFICDVAAQVIAYEIDRDLSVFLDEIKGQYSNLEIIYQDFLKTELKSELTWELIGNLPYYITTPIIFKFLETPSFNSATIMIQKEVGERLISKPNSKKYNALSVIIQYLTDIKKLVNVSKKMFNPMPEVDSVVIQMTKRNNRHFSIEKEDSFFRFVKASFDQKRKTLTNNITSNYDVNKKEFIALLSDNNYNENVRAEQLEIKDFIKLFEAFEK